MMKTADVTNVCSVSCLEWSHWCIFVMRAKGMAKAASEEEKRQIGTSEGELEEKTGW